MRRISSGYLTESPNGILIIRFSITSFHRQLWQKMSKKKFQSMGKFELSDKLSLGDPLIPLQKSIKTKSFLIRKFENLIFESGHIQQSSSSRDKIHFSFFEKFWK